jgi:hypothetical protein
MLKYQKFDAAAQYRFYSSDAEKIVLMADLVGKPAHFAVRDQWSWRDVIETSAPTIRRKIT